ncbi:lipid-binding SYLF domain-containing protein [Poritiphilus flavus]|uniref:Ysc84 actin-binding domain-containing protein n=1 Tax=Poritiphilus flavus TaxID=2697053 RepID=A0A6L9EBU9_9FLAO|nr:YSC84-related protein [Poritiphilus flavus]NAS12175.1 hypothetical protein [Poritiphilus flavus]
MKKMKLKMSELFTTTFALFLSLTVIGQVDGWNPNLELNASEAMQIVLEKSPKLESFKDEAYGYAVFPKVTKAAIGVGGAAGNGIVYEEDEVVGRAHLKQVTAGIQFGGQQYIEVIFFENEETFEKFTNGKLKFDAQASAVALKSGVSIDAAYQDGVAVFTLTKGGVMYEASIGGQHFNYHPKVKTGTSK